MIFYITILIMICITAFFFNLSKKKKVRNECYVIFWGFIFFFLYALKDNEVGSDYPTYLNYFMQMQPGDWSILSFDSDTFIPDFEKGYMLLTQVMANISQTDMCFALVMAFIMSVFPLIVIDKYTKPVWMGIFLFFALSLYTNSFSMLRQNIAMYICWFSIPYIVNRSFWKFLLVVFIAFLFHKTAVVFFPIYFLYNFRFTFGYYVFAFLGVVVLYILLLPLMELITELLSMNDYLDADVSGGYVFLLFIAFCYVFCAYVLRNEKDPYKHIFLHMLFVAFLLQLLATKFNILTRIIDYYKISLIVLLPTAVWKPLFRKNRIFIVCMFVVLFIYYFYRTNMANFTHAIPYVLR